MFGYDWPRLHAALNDLPAALLLVAVLFDLPRLPLQPARASGWPGSGPSWPARSAGSWRWCPGCRRRSTSLTARRCTADGDPREARAHHAGHLRGPGALADLRESRMGGTERALVLALSLVGTGHAPGDGRRTAASSSSTTRRASRPRCCRPRCTSAARATITTAREGDADEAAEHDGDRAHAAPRPFGRSPATALGQAHACAGHPAAQGLSDAPDGARRGRW